MKENSFLPLFLFDSKYRIWRHLLFILVGTIITFNQVFIAYQDSQHILGNRIYLICLSSFVLYLAAMYFNYFYLTPRLLLKGRYIAYLIALCAIVFLLPTLAIAEEYMVRNALGLSHRISSYTNPLILVDNLSTTIITAVCFCGISIVILFRHWLNGNEHINRLEGEHIKSEVNKLKGQIAPGFLSKTLRSASASTETDPEKTSGMLMLLGQLLRYQLYDCNRERVLLKSEINFVEKLLELEQTNNPGLEYHIHTEGDINNLFISPMLFISLVQTVIEPDVCLELFFKRENRTLLFTGKSNSEKEQNSNRLSLIKKRLELQYPGKYRLTEGRGNVELTLDIPE